jgi:hypothetical protein
MILVGSRAAKYWGINRSEPKDTDVWYRGEQPEAVPHQDSFYCPEHIYDLMEVDEKGVATPDCLYTLKCSHLGVNAHIENERIWWKHVKDILWFKEEHCCILIPDLYKALVEYWLSSGKDKDHLSLKMDKEDFFNDFVEYRYDHDYLHELVAYPNTPVYEKCLKEGEEVLLDKQLFDRLDYCDKIRMFREEITVIACERWLLNPKNTLSWYQAYHESLKKTITRLTKNWACDFIIMNLEEFVIPEFSYFKHILETLKEELMPKVDLEVFEKLKKALQSEEGLGHLVIDLAEAEEWMDYSEPQIGSGLGWQERRDKIKEVLDSFGYVHLDQEGGGEGGSEYCYGVFKLGEKFYRAEYSYYSHHGYEYDGIVDTLREVKPVEKTITVYE